VQISDIDLTTKEQQAMASVLQRIATGPDLSKDISEAEAKAATVAILEGKIDPARAALFFIALRMKRETPEENRGILSGIKAVADIQTANVEHLIDIADPYNGYNRTLPASPFLPALLAACGIAAVSHGLYTCSPKFGVTHKQILTAAGYNTDLSVADAVQKIETVGWSYVDQSQFCKPLHDLVDFRTLVIKRLPLTTVEVAVGPIRATGKTHLATGYVHKPYPPVYGMLAKHSGFDSSLLIRGVEGGVIPSLRQPSKMFHYDLAGIETTTDYHPTEIGIEQDVRAVTLPEDWKVPDNNSDIAQAAAQAGLDALAGKQGASYDALLYAASIMLAHVGTYTSIGEAATAVRRVLDSGKARVVFDA